MCARETEGGGGRGRGGGGGQGMGAARKAPRRAIKGVPGKYLMLLLIIGVM